MNIVIKKKKKKIAGTEKNDRRWGGLEPTNVWSGVQRLNHSSTFVVHFEGSK